MAKASMNKLRKNKKAVLITLGVLLIALVLLSMSKLMLTDNYESEERAKEIAIFDRIGNLHSSTERSIMHVFNFTSGIDISKNGNNITFTENIPNSITTFTSEINSLKTYVEADTEEITLNVDEITTSLPLAIKPGNINYTHDFSNDQIQVIPASVNFDAYDIDITSDQNITTCSWNITSGTFEWDVNIEGNTGSCSGSQSINPNVANTLTVNYASGVLMRIVVNNSGKLYVINNAGTAQVTTTIALGDTDYENIRVDLPADTFYISFPTLEISRLDAVTIFE